MRGEEKPSGLAQGTQCEGHSKQCFFLSRNCFGPEPMWKLVAFPLAHCGSISTHTLLPSRSWHYPVSPLVPLSGTHTVSFNSLLRI